jgi:RND superfamily putative drug exporter
VIGLSLILLMIVFRSIAVPLKATMGYLLSVGAALGAVVAVFQWGWLQDLMGLNPGPIVSFLPIFVMGVLFGLAMDYEMFLVSAMREEYVQSGDPREAVVQGFRSSAKVVTAAALIMSSVFVAFIPGGSATIKPIALGLAVGVFVDAFIVRMTLVPAVLVLLGNWAWWLPKALERRLPEVDVEGAALHRKVDFESWESEHGVAAVLTTDLVVHAGDPPLRVVAEPARVTRVSGGRDVARVLAGRSRPAAGHLMVAGRLLPEQREAINKVATMIDLAAPATTTDFDSTVATRARLVSFSRRHRRAYAAQVSGLVHDLTKAMGSTGSLHPAVVEAALAVASRIEVIVLVGIEDLGVDDRIHATGLADELARHEIAVLLVGSVPTQAAEDEPGQVLVESGAGADHE